MLSICSIWSCFVLNMCLKMWAVKRRGNSFSDHPVVPLSSFSDVSCHSILTILMSRNTTMST